MTLQGAVYIDAAPAAAAQSGKKSGGLFGFGKKTQEPPAGEGPNTPKQSQMVWLERGVEQGLKTPSSGTGTGLQTPAAQCGSAMDTPPG